MEERLTIQPVISLTGGGGGQACMGSTDSDSAASGTAL